MVRFFLILALLAATLAAQADRDRVIEAEIQRRLEKSLIGEEGFRVTVKSGVAYWSGQTAVPQRKGAATRMAKSAGAAKVVNNIRVTTAKSVPPKSSRPRSEAKPATGKSAGGMRSEPRQETKATPVPRRVRVEWRPVHP